MNYHSTTRAAMTNAELHAHVDWIDENGIQTLPDDGFEFKTGDDGRVWILQRGYPWSPEPGRIVAWQSEAQARKAVRCRQQIQNKPHY